MLHLHYVLHTYAWCDLAFQEKFRVPNDKKKRLLPVLLYTSLRIRSKLTVIILEDIKFFFTFYLFTTIFILIAKYTCDTKKIGMEKI